jgi:hypothetical protein
MLQFWKICDILNSYKTRYQLHALRYLSMSSQSIAKREF